MDCDNIKSETLYYNSLNISHKYNVVGEQHKFVIMSGSKYFTTTYNQITCTAVDASTTE